MAGYLVTAKHTMHIERTTQLERTVVVSEPSPFDCTVVAVQIVAAVQTVVADMTV